MIAELLRRMHPWDEAEPRGSRRLRPPRPCKATRPSPPWKVLSTVECAVRVMI